jgi:hypothetical protein
MMNITNWSGSRLIVFLLVTALVSCKSKCSCIAAPGLNPSLIAFDSVDVDTIVVKKFVKGSGFTNFIDSVVLDGNNSLYQRHHDTIDVTIGVSNAALTSAYDYEILFPTPGVNLKITAIDETTTDGNCPGDSQCVDPINSYKINDSLVMKQNPFDNKLTIWN